MLICSLKCASSQFSIFYLQHTPVATRGLLSHRAQWNMISKSAVPATLVSNPVAYSWERDEPATLYSPKGTSWHTRKTFCLLVCLLMPGIEPRSLCMPGQKTFLECSLDMAFIEAHWLEVNHYYVIYAITEWCKQIQDINKSGYKQIQIWKAPRTPRRDGCSEKSEEKKAGWPCSHYCGPFVERWGLVSYP